MTFNDQLLYLLQISDSGFPTGSFSHSLGLEAAIKLGNVRNIETLKQFIHCCLENAGSFQLPFVRDAYSGCHDVEKLCELDKLCEACTSNHVARRASTRQGTSMLDTCSKVFQDKYLQSLAETLPYKHQSVVFGAVCGQLRLGVQPSLLALLYSSVRTVMASAVRLDIVGPIQAQTIQLEIQHRIPEVVKIYQDRGSDNACIVHPHVDIIQNTHDTMFTKLFYS